MDEQERKQLIKETEERVARCFVQAVNETNSIGAMLDVVDLTIVSKKVLQNFVELTNLMNELKRGTCWCEAGIDNPVVQGKHSETCLKIQKIIESAKYLIP